jgi:cell division protein FtsW (lipid II flippase)
MKVRFARLSAILRGAKESMLWTLALLFVLWTAQLVQQHSDPGLQRWKNDVANANLQLDRQILPGLTLSWCQSNPTAVGDMLPRAHAIVCDSPGIWIRFWNSQSKIERTDVRHEKVVAGWQEDIRTRSTQLRELIGRIENPRLVAELLGDRSSNEVIAEDSVALSRQEEVSLEKQAADDALRSRSEAIQRQEQWDGWVKKTLDPLLKLPVDETDVLALWSVARSLDGYGSDAGSQIVRRHLSAATNAQKANQLLLLNESLQRLLAFHAFMTWLMFSVARRPWTWVVQSLMLTGLGLIFWGGLYLLGGSASPMLHPVALSALTASMVLLWLLRHFGKSTQRDTVKNISVSVFLLPGWWFFTAIGWLLLWDQSLNFHPRLRFLALEQWFSWCIASWLMALMACHSLTLTGWVHRLNVWCFSMLTFWQIVGRILVGIGVIALFAALHRLGVGQYMTGEMAKGLVVIAAAGWSLWKLPMIAEFWQARLTREVLPNLMLLVAILLIAAMIAVVTSDKGPLLVLGMVLVVLLSSGLGWTTGIAMVALGLLILVMVGVDLEVVGGRLQAWRNPFTADHDDMARLVWFQAVASESSWGFGPGQTPWCGSVQWERCYGLPLQLQSDYTFTAIKGWWGPLGSWLLVLVFSLWCFHLMAHAARQSNERTTPLSLLSLPRVLLAQQAHLLFITALLILLQSWVTVAGNLGWLPLTGVTWPLLSFGKASLWFSSVLLGAWGLRSTHA